MGCVRMGRRGGGGLIGEEEGVYGCRYAFHKINKNHLLCVDMFDFCLSWWGRPAAEKVLWT